MTITPRPAPRSVLASYWSIVSILASHWSILKRDNVKRVTDATEDILQHTIALEAVNKVSTSFLLVNTLNTCFSLVIRTLWTLRRVT